MTRKQVEARLRSGRWPRLHPGVYATFTGDPRGSALLWGALLRAGDAAVLSHHTATDLHGLTVSPATAIHVMVPSGQRVSAISGVALHYSRRVAQARHPVRTPPQTRIEETVLDLAAGAPGLDEALGWIFRACGSHKTPGRPAPVPGRDLPGLRRGGGAGRARGAPGGAASSRPGPPPEPDSPMDLDPAPDLPRPADPHRSPRPPAKDAVA
jgi:hypothetical protein